MSEEASEVASFGFGIRVVKHPDGREEYQTRAENDGVSTETVIMQLRAYLNSLEKDYFDDFDKRSAKFKQE